jgi:transposase
LVAALARFALNYCLAWLLLTATPEYSELLYQVEAINARSARTGDVVNLWPSKGKGKERWSHSVKKELVLRLFRGEPSHAVSREMAVPIYQLERWRSRALAGIDAGLRQSDSDPMVACLEDANRRIDQLAKEVEVLKGRRRAPSKRQTECSSSART